MPRRPLISVCSHRLWPLSRMRKRTVGSRIALLLVLALLLGMFGCAWQGSLPLADELLGPGSAGISEAVVQPTSESQTAMEELGQWLEGHGISLVRRPGWGANESYRGSNFYKPVAGLIIHHTVHPNTASDWPRRVLGIQDDHVAKGYWDIGYHFLIAPDGTVYEGRAGRLDEQTVDGLRWVWVDGERQLQMVFGAHAMGDNHEVYNPNSEYVGVGFLGCFLSDLEWEGERKYPNTDAEQLDRYPYPKLDYTGEPKEQAVEAAEKLIEWISTQSGLNACSIFGHRDIQTNKPVCPGFYLYSRLPDMRSVVSGQGISIDPNSPSYLANGGSGSISVIAPASGCRWRASSQETWITITSGDGIRTGSANVGYSVDALGSETSRSGVIVIGGLRHIVSQGTGEEPSASIEVVAPEADSIWVVGSDRTIRWRSSGLDSDGKIYIYYLLDGNWHLVSGPLDPNSTSCSWTVPNTPTSSAVVFVGNAGGSNWQVFGRSRSTFTIAEDEQDPPDEGDIDAQISSYDVTPRQLTTGGQVSFECTVRNTGNTRRTFYVDLSLRKPNNSTVNRTQQSVTLNAGSSSTVNWTYSPSDVGDWDVVFGVWKESSQQNSLDTTGWLYNHISVSQVLSQTIEITISSSAPSFQKGSNSGHMEYWHTYSHNGHVYLWTYTNGYTVDCWARFQPSLPTAGRYSVYACFYADPEGPRAVPYSVVHSSGTATINVDAYAPSYFTWRELKLGTWYFQEGSAAAVTVTDATGDPYNPSLTFNVEMVRFVLE